MVEGIHQRRFYEAGKTIFNKGDKAERFYFIESGSIEMWDSVPEKQKVLTLEKGNMFGEMALLDSSERMYTAITGSAGATLVVVQVEYMEKVLKDAHPLVSILVKRLLENMRKLQK